MRCKSISNRIEIESGSRVDAAIVAVRAAFEAVDLSYGHGTDSANDEAAWLVFAAAELDHSDAATAYSQLLDQQQCQKIESLTTQRIEKRLPLAYLLGEAYFAGLAFSVNEHVLVPRSPLAELIINGFEPWLGAEEIRTALDIGTGSGCIAIALAHYFAHIDVVASDISAAALAVARRNVARHGLGSRVQLRESDVFAGLPEQRFDLIISNPPYVDAPAMQALPAEYRHEPAGALAAGPDGLQIVKIMLAQAADFLSDRGILVVEVGDSDEALAAAMPHLPFTWLTMSDGLSGIFLITRDELINAVKSV